MSAQSMGAGREDLGLHEDLRGFEFWLFHFVVSCVSSLSLSFLICKLLQLIFSKTHFSPPTKRKKESRNYLQSHYPEIIRVQ